MKIWNMKDRVEVEVITIEGMGNGSFIYYCMDDELNTYVLHRDEFCTLREHAEKRDRVGVRNIYGFDRSWL